jgi:hypothetical protein
MKVVVSAILLTIIFIFSCNENSTTEPEQTFFDVQGPNGFAGTLNGTNAFVALLVDDNESIAYVCNGEEEISEWFRGAINDPNEIDLTNGAGAQISAKFSGNSFEGQVTLRNGKIYSLKATPNRTEGVGIFRVIGDEAKQDSVEAGWIVNSEGDQRGALLIRSIFQTTPVLNFDDITDGSSNTILIGETRFSVFRFSR